jgi:hypothetical protein
MRRLLVVLSVVAASAAVSAGCGSKFQLPTEHPAAAIVPSDKSYAHLQTWKGMDNVLDILITQGPGSQLFILKNWGGAGPPTSPRGDVQLYPYSQPVPVNNAAYFQPPRELFNPVAMAWAPQDTFLYVLDQGDTCMAKYDVRRGTCEAFAQRDSAQVFRSIIRDYTATWRVRQYRRQGGDTVSTFTDTTFAVVNGIAADDAGRVYVSGWQVVLDTLQNDPRIRTRMLKSRVIRYAPGPRYPGVFPPDTGTVNYMPGANWHRDTTWRVIDGTGLSFVSDPTKMTWTTQGGGSIFVTDRGNNAAKGIATWAPQVPVVKMDGSETPTGTAFHAPEGVGADRAGYYYVVDRLNKRVLRYDMFGTYVQDVNVENNSDGLPLLDPIAIGVDDSLAYVVDKGRGQVIRYKRRP